MSPNRPSYTTDTLVESLVRAQQQHSFFPLSSSLPQPVVVAVSGGVDSVVLLHILVQMATEWQLELHFAHIDHALRPESAADAAFVRTLATQFGLPFHATRLDGATLRADPAGLEAAARHARYRSLCTIAVNVTPTPLVPTLAVAHHADDQAETVLLRLVQGSGLRGLGAMRPVATIDDPTLTPRPVRVVRPLLALPRAEIVAFAQRHGLAWREDVTNQDASRPRNLVRHLVLSLLARINPQVVATLGRTADLLAEEAERLARHDASLLAQCLVRQDPDRAVLRLAPLQQMAAGDVRGLLYHALMQLGADLRDIGFEQLTALAQSVATATHRSGPHPLAQGLAWSIVALPEGELALALHRQNALPLPPSTPWFDDAEQQQRAIAVPAEGCVELGEWRLECTVLDRADLPEAWQRNPDRWTAYFDADAAIAARLAPPQPALKIDPLGMGGQRKTLGDLFTDARIDPALRRGWPVLYAPNGRVLWVCGLAQSHATRITAATQTVWVLRWRHHSTDEGKPNK